MLFFLLLFIAYTNLVYAAKLEDIIPCINETNCGESIDSSVYTQSPKTNDPVLDDSSNDTEENDPHLTISTEITTTSGNLNITEQPEIQSTVTTISQIAVNIPSNNEKGLKFEKKEICECDLIVCVNI